MNRKYVVGDIHGMYYKLQSILNQIDFDEDDYLIFLGDYIDRGTENLKVLKTVYELQQKYPHVVCLKGNHEEMLLNFLKYYSLEEDVFFSNNDYWINGGKTTFKELRQLYQTDRQYCEKIISWIRQLPYYYELDGMMFSHAGCNPYTNRQTVNDYVWTREAMILGYDGDKTWYIGHTPVQFLEDYIDYDTDDRTPKPIVLPNNIVMMDTGSYLPRGRVSCLEITKNRLYQSPMEAY